MRLLIREHKLGIDSRTLAISGISFNGEISQIKALIALQGRQDEADQGSSVYLFLSPSFSLSFSCFSSPPPKDARQRSRSGSSRSDFPPLARKRDFSRELSSHAGDSFFLSTINLRLPPPSRFGLELLDPKFAYVRVQWRLTIDRVTIRDSDRRASRLDSRSCISCGRIEGPHDRSAR
jgi:hypothetical protein